MVSEEGENRLLKFKHFGQTHVYGFLSVEIYDKANIFDEYYLDNLTFISVMRKVTRKNIVCVPQPQFKTLTMNFEYEAGEDMSDLGNTQYIYFFNETYQFLLTQIGRVFEDLKQL